MQQLEIMKSNTDETFAIVVNNCGQCPYIARVCNFHEFVCNHPSRVAFKPYCNDRLVNPTIIDSNCPLQPKSTSVENKCLTLNGDCIACGGCSL